MPNWVKNVVKIKKLNQKGIDDFLENFIDKDGNFDFNKIIPMPDYIFKGNLGNEEREKYGNNNWYDWSIENWGTKWNACYTFIQRKNTQVIIKFDTAWSCPIPIYDKLAQLGYDFEVKYADEDMGHNCGKFYYENGEKFDNMEGINDLKRFARRVWGDC